MREAPTADDPAVLGAMSTPVLVLHGTDTKPFWIRSAGNVSDHVPNLVEALGVKTACS